jgi:hypothetical protein
MKRLMWGLACGGTLSFGLAKGAVGGLSFLLGALISIASFHYTDRYVNRMGSGGRSTPSTFTAALAGLRYLFIAALVYVLAATAGLQVLEALLGMLVAAAAVLIGMIYELALSRSR